MGQNFESGGISLSHEVHFREEICDFIRSFNSVNISVSWSCVILMDFAKDKTSGFSVLLKSPSDRDTHIMSSRFRILFENRPTGVILWLPWETAFKALWIELPSNPLYQQNIDKLVPVLTNVYAQWAVANTFEASKEQLNKAYMLRASVYQIFITLAEIIGGLSWVEQIGPKIFSLYG